MDEDSRAALHTRHLRAHACRRCACSTHARRVHLHARHDHIPDAVLLPRPAVGKRTPRRGAADRLVQRDDGRGRRRRLDHRAAVDSRGVGRPAADGRGAARGAPVLDLPPRRARAALGLRALGSIRRSSLDVRLVRPPPPGLDAALLVGEASLAAAGPLFISFVCSSVVFCYSFVCSFYSFVCTSPARSASSSTSAPTPGATRST